MVATVRSISRLLEGQNDEIQNSIAVASRDLRAFQKRPWAGEIRHLASQGIDSWSRERKAENVRRGTNAKKNFIA